MVLVRRQKLAGGDYEPTHMDLETYQPLSFLYENIQRYFSWIIWDTWAMVKLHGMNGLWHVVAIHPTIGILLLAMIIPMDMHGMTTIHQYVYVIQVLTGCTHVGFLELGVVTSKLDNLYNMLNHSNHRSGKIFGHHHVKK